MDKLLDSIFKNKYLGWVQIFTNWMMQGIKNADKSEKAYKISFTVFFWILFFSIFSYFLELGLYTNLVVSFIFAHTLNWFVNCNIFVLYVHRMKWLKTTKPELFGQLYDIKERLNMMPNKDWIQYSVSHGGICNGTLNEHSDIDVSLIRKPGFKNMIAAIIFYVKEKKYADLKGIPLDIFICDSPENCIERSNWQKNPIILFDPNDEVDKYYPDKLKISIEEAQVLNGEIPKKIT